VLHARSNLLFGRTAEMERVLRQALHLCPTDSPHRLIILNDLAVLFASGGRLKALQPEFDRLPPTIPGVFAYALFSARLLNEVELGRTERARALAARPPADARPRASQTNFVRQFLIYADLIDGRPVAEPAPWAASCRHLAEGRPREALVAARAEQDRPGHRVIESWIGFTAFVLVRAELACGHAAAAARLLESRSRRGNVHFLDSFFASRLHNLAGRREEARSAFAEAIAAADRLDARRRLEYELRIACELSRDDVLRLLGAPVRAPKESSPAAEAAPPTAGVARLLGASAAVANLRDLVARYAGLDTHVLVCGETGSGKELVARALHEESPRAERPFVAVNCAALSETLLESELFGHDKGAFTGAARAHAGLFEQAGEGTLLLDEIGDVSPRLQAALLRVLENGEFRRVGSERTLQARCRVVAATNADLPALARQGRFRSDLLFRLRRLEIVVPPLRDRREDIVPLALHFLSEGRTDGRRPALEPELAKEMESRSWPGNVRELRHAMERLRLLNSEALSYGLPEFRGLEAPGASVPEQTASSVALAAGPVFVAGRSPMRRRERILALFRAQRRLTRSEIVAAVGVSPNTVTSDLAALDLEGHIERVEPTRSPRTHWFRLREAPGDGSSGLAR
jgi:DNA-binding NtrC family response regulator